jgi:hypothetical protein
MTNRIPGALQHLAPEAETLTGWQCWTDQPEQGQRPAAIADAA